MTQVKPNPILRLMPSMTDVAFLLPIVMLFTRLEGVRTMLGDGDTGWHIRTGEWMLAHHAIPRADLFSFTRPGQPWFAWEWLWDAAAAWLHQRWGLGAVVLASIFILCLTFALLYRLLNRRCGNGVIAIAITALAAAGSAIHWLARPHLFTWLFIVIFLHLIERVRQGRTHLLLWMPLLTILWTNLHGGFLAGVVILGAYAGGELIRALLATGARHRNQALRAAVPYLLTALGCLAASLINPYFYHLHAHIFEYLGDPYEMKHIGEFQSISFQHPAARYFEIMLALAAGTAISLTRKQNFGNVALIAGWAHLGLISSRNIPIFMLCSAPAVAETVARSLTALAKTPLPRWITAFAGFFGAVQSEIAPFENVGRVHAVCALVIAAIGLGTAAPGAGKLLKPEYDPKSYPAAALAKLDRPDQRIFTHDEWGDYLIYQLSPKGTKVYVDGRSDFYGPKFCEEYIDLLNVKYDWEQTLARYGVDTILLPPDAALASTVKESSHWRVVYDDGSAIVFQLARPDAERNSTSRTSGRDRGLAITESKSTVGETQL